jgi:hypothetical protein
MGNAALRRNGPDYPYPVSPARERGDGRAQPMIDGGAALC